MAIYTFPPAPSAPLIQDRAPLIHPSQLGEGQRHHTTTKQLLTFSESAMYSPSPSTTTSSSAEHEEYRTAWSAPPKKPAGRTKFRETRHPVYRGVRRRGQAQAARWVCEVRVPGGRGSRLWLGAFATPELAARAHDAAAIALSPRGGACLNFADSAWLLPPLMPAAALSSAPELASAREIKDAVAEAVEAFRRRSVAEPTPSSPATKDTAPDKEDDDNAGSEPGAMASNDAVFEFEDPFRFGGMVDAGSYYASLAQGLLVDPLDAAGAWPEDAEHGAADIALWSY